MNTTAPVTEQFGPLTVITWKDAHGISINVHTAGTRNSALSATYRHADRAQAKTWYRTIRDAALAGTPVWLIEAQVSALIDAVQAVGPDAKLAAAVNATMDAVQADLEADTARQQAAVADIVNGPRTGWRNLRHEFRQVRPTRTNTHVQPLTPAMRRLARQHNNGIVRLPAGTDWRILAGIADRGHGTVHEARGYRVTAVRLNQRGLAVAAQTEERAA